MGGVVGGVVVVAGSVVVLGVVVVVVDEELWLFFDLCDECVDGDVVVLSVVVVVVLDGLAGDIGSLVGDVVDGVIVDEPGAVPVGDCCICAAAGTAISAAAASGIR